MSPYVPWEVATHTPRQGVKHGNVVQTNNAATRTAFRRSSSSASICFSMCAAFCTTARPTHQHQRRAVRCDKRTATTQYVPTPSILGEPRAVPPFCARAPASGCSHTCVCQHARAHTHMWLAGGRGDDVPHFHAQLTHADQVLVDLRQALLVLVHDELAPVRELLVDLLQCLGVVAGELWARRARHGPGPGADCTAPPPPLRTRIFSHRFFGEWARSTVLTYK